MVRYLAPLVLFLVLAGFLWKGLSLNPSSVPSPLVGKPAPQFELEQLQSSIKMTRDIQVVTAPVEVPVPVEEPIVEEKEVSPCIWYQAEVIKKRMCPVGYRCSSECTFHAGMMKKEKYRNDPRIKPYLDKVNALVGTNQCRYTMSGDVSFRICPNIYHCEECEFHQISQDEVDRQLELKKTKREQMRQAKNQELN